MRITKFGDCLTVKSPGNAGAFIVVFLGVDYSTIIFRVAVLPSSVILAM